MKKIIETNIPGRRLRPVYIVIMAAVCCMTNLFAQNNQAPPTRQASIEAFTKGNYEQAYNDFRQLLQKYPKDPLYKYYSGACLVMMKKDPAEALSLLQQSVNGASVVRSLPPDAVFYLGRAQQMSGRYSEAISSFASYTEQVGKKAAREQGVPGYIQECENKRGAVEASGAKPAGEELAAGVKITSDKPAAVPAAGNKSTAPASGEAPERKALPQEYEKLLDEALRFQYKADSLNLVATEQKKQLDKLPEDEKSSLKMKISQNEILAATYQKSADLKYSEAQARMNPAIEIAPPKTDTMPASAVKPAAAKEEKKTVSGSEGEPQTLRKETAANVMPAASFSLFEILPKDAVYPDEKIKINPEVPPGLIYRIQIAVFRNAVAPSFFKGITPVYGFKAPGGNNTSYYAGMFRRSADAKKALLDVKATGFKDAFIVALSDNKTVSADRAAVLENEWGTKPFVDESLPATATDTLPPTLSFRVEVARSMKPLKPDAVEAMRVLAGSRGLDILHLSDGNIVYLIGKFITFESAAEYADLLVRNNYRGAKVVAWLGNKEVPVETARQLFNNL